MPEAIVKSGVLAPERGKIWRYGVAPTAVALSLAARALLLPYLHDDTVFLYFVPAVLISAGIGGLGPGLLATGLSIAAALFALNQTAATPNPAVINGIAFGGIGIGVSWGGELLLSSRRRAIVMTRDALAGAAHLQSILDTVPEAMIVIDEHGIMQSFSSAAERLFGIQAAEAIGRSEERR